MRILLVGGGSGGHVYPVIAIANVLKERGDAKLLLLGDDKFMRPAAEENGLQFRPVMSGKLRRYFSLLIFLDIFKFPIGLFQSLWHIFWFMPDVVFAKGGYVSVLPALVAKLYLIPLYIHESDSVPGLANKFLGRLANKIFISFQISAAYFDKSKTVLTGNPVRRDLLTGDRNEAAKLFSLSPDKKTVFVYGGSQGAQKINDIVLESLVMMVGKDLQMIHQCGSGQYETVKKLVDKFVKEGEGGYGDAITQHYRLEPFLDLGKVRAAYALADVIVSRAGASNIFEIAAVGKPAIIIPITASSGNHQLNNAMAFNKHGAVMIEEENLTPHIVLSQIEYLLKPENYEAVSQKIKSFATPDATDKIAEAILSISKS
ncbi:MAG: hypothetical protein A2655_01350 [Candidatus Yanofskybacteria bacterium RIFCSPHIGHO2_01_FULL_43_42]|uniref:UDP-N-acetylglucosamine--N-acetylmuramyl-(pentapeptide) pyrophosphoryl-undecaprenol N-acetylglucosamine transferase n=1 Tax=Candidatus Yanofskybacteria bacterium RIFCSPLOWO2_01_FULL_43_22 TaxID=1802695 RepID=A0A1F8GGW4_9BACT|nr:MAG: hypothetical protein A2655_01350 [Candidatus Yanofskybacteria bacterium RIFCSPHIGHO2_01_FULL_43_42]OGN13130.1 MAG: hypothetical protein A3D48_02265 [Candidatus Yanofskybacteria bacterium RIFCSPHIGHO2_02_FULL_43_17]OGN24543.1 MAG: hypothetical protein A3A13_00480 [Candidatus Yanofskybacteria bacterium RIFCSPLOWO2_01_FULL_43_22]